MVTFGSKSETSTEMRKYSRHLYSTLESETGLSTGFKPVGFIELASDADRLEEYRRISAFNRKCGVNVQEITPKEVQKLFPLCKVDDVLAGFYVPEDGRVNPVDVSMSLARGAKIHGAKLYEGIRVEGVTETVINGQRRVSGVKTSTGAGVIISVSLISLRSCHQR
jgi:glycine/D-amino acid oxidase-like deaminating enzyme